MINKHFNKTPYEIWNGKIPKVSYFRIFGCKCFIHNNGKDHLTAFDAKADTGIMISYSSVSKAYRVFNKRTLTVEESMHVVFDEFAEQTSNKIDEIANRLEKSNLLSDSEDEFDNHRNITSISHQTTTLSDDVLNDADRAADSPAVQ